MVLWVSLYYPYCFNWRRPPITCETYPLLSKFLSYLCSEFPFLQHCLNNVYLSFQAQFKCREFPDNVLDSLNHKWVFYHTFYSTLYLSLTLALSLALEKFNLMRASCNLSPKLWLLSGLWGTVHHSSLYTHRPRPVPCLSSLFCPCWLQD